MQIINFLKERISALISEEGGQDAVEYLVTIGAVSVAILAAAFALYATAPGFVTAVCTAISGVDGSGGLSITC